MKAIIVQFTFGIALFNEAYEFKEISLFEKNPKLAAKFIKDIEAGRIPLKLKSFIDQLRKNDFDIFAFESAKLTEIFQKFLENKIEIIPISHLAKIRLQMEKIALNSGFIQASDELISWNRDVGIELAKLKIKKASEKRDLILGQSIQTLDDLDRTINLFINRIREWYGIHFPELDRLLEKHETYARLVLNIGNRKSFSITNLENEAIPKEKAKKISKSAINSMGAEIANIDLNQIQDLSKNILNFYNLRKGMEKYIDNTMEDIAPNTRFLAGSLLGARLISIAGGLQNLAMRPASTIQVLGAEKALFRSLKTGSRPPKHGLIFQHNLLHDAKRWQRGKIARALAGKITIAVRTDAFNGKFVGNRLKKEVDERIAEIKKKYKDPPPQKERTMKTKESKPRNFKRRKRRFKKKGRKKKGAYSS